MNDHLDLTALCRSLAEKFGPVAASPSRLLALTPFELLSLFFREPGASGDEIDRAAELHRVNHVIRAGREPVVPGWLMPQVPRALPAAPPLR